MKKKIYISLPITGIDAEKVKDYAELVEMEYNKRGYDVVNPLKVCQAEGMPYAYYMGRDIEALLGCDCILMCIGWQNSKGCMAEFEVARIYGKEIMFCEL